MKGVSVCPLGWGDMVGPLTMPNTPDNVIAKNPPDTRPLAGRRRTTGLYHPVESHSETETDTTQLRQREHGYFMKSGRVSWDS